MEAAWGDMEETVGNNWVLLSCCLVLGAEFRVDSMFDEEAALAVVFDRTL